jgi:hypothetical protein
VVPGIGLAVALSAAVSSADDAGCPPPAIMADWSNAAAPLSCGAAMLVPPATSSPTSQAGTLENATPGAHRSGFCRLPPRLLHQPSTSSGERPPGCGGLANTPGNNAQAASAKSADPGNPIVEMPGPSLPALITIVTSGCSTAKASSTESIRARPAVASFPTP